jgi:hypothetical protein
MDAIRLPASMFGFPRIKSGSTVEIRGSTAPSGVLAPTPGKSCGSDFRLTDVL